MPPPDVASHLEALALENLDVSTLATMLDASCHYDMNYNIKEASKCIFAEFVALPHHDAWSALDEFYTSLARIEKFMSNRATIDNEILADRWPWVFPLMMATGKAEVGFWSLMSVSSIPS